jgi:hypothetical protein
MDSTHEAWLSLVLVALFGLLLFSAYEVSQSFGALGDGRVAERDHTVFLDLQLFPAPPQSTSRQRPVD